MSISICCNRPWFCKEYARMPTVSELQVLLEHVDLKILDLLRERRRLIQDASEEGEREEEEATIEMWIDEGAERDLDDLALEKVCRGVVALSRRGGE